MKFNIDDEVIILKDRIPGKVVAVSTRILAIEVLTDDDSTSDWYKFNELILKSEEKERLEDELENHKESLEDTISDREGYLRVILEFDNDIDDIRQSIKNTEKLLKDISCQK